MARPLVLIYQDLQQTSVPPSTPDLNSVIVAPCYVIYDYPDDAQVILLTQTYGQLNQPSGTAGSVEEYIPPAANTPTVTVVAYPGITPGAIVNQASVRLFLQNPHVVIGAATSTFYGEQELGTNVTTYATTGLQNKVTFTSPTVSLVTAGVQSGDIAILTDSTGVVVVATVLSVGEPNAMGVVTDPESLRLTANLPGSWTDDDMGFCRIERGLPSQEYVDTVGNVITFPNVGSDTLVINGGIFLPVNGVKMPLSYAGIYLPYTALRQDLASDVNSVSTSDLLTDSIGRPNFAALGIVDARNPLAAGVYVALLNSGTAPVYYFGVQANTPAGYEAALAVTEYRDDLWAFAIMTTDLTVLGAYELDFNTLADPSQALANGVPQKFRAVIGSTLLPINSTIAPQSVTGCSQNGADISTGLYNTVNFATSGPTTDCSSVVAGDHMTIGLVPAGGTWTTRRGLSLVSHVNQSPDDPPTDAQCQIEIVPTLSRWNSGGADSSGHAEILITDPTGTIVKVSLLASLFLTSNSVGPSATGVTINALVPTTQGGPYTFQYLDTLSAPTPVITIAGFVVTVNIQATVTTTTQIITAINTNPVLSQLVHAVQTGAESVQHTAMGSAAPMAAPTDACSITLNDHLYTWLFDINATFLTDGVQPGDIVQIPINPNNYLFSAFTGPILSYSVAQVISENLLAVQTLGDDTATADNELPHFYNRHIEDSYITDIDNGSPSINYQVVRTLTSDDQINDLIAAAQSVSNKRCVIVWPDLVTVDGLNDGSLPRGATPLVPAPAANQNGAYIACQVAGALAGLPVQQGLTNLGLAGISTIYHSTKFFREAQLTLLSDGGLFVMQQLAPDALPECIHQLTTDPTAVETGELSVVRNIDFVSISTQQVVNPFLGQWNVLPETLTAILSAVNVNFISMQNQKVARIGAPLTSGTVTSLVVDPSASNRVVMVCNIQVAEPLNGADVHLVI